MVLLKAVATIMKPEETPTELNKSVFTWNGEGLCIDALDDVLHEPKDSARRFGRPDAAAK